MGLVEEHRRPSIAGCSGNIVHSSFQRFRTTKTKAKVKCVAGGGQTTEPGHSPSTDERDLPASQLIIIAT